MKGMMQMQDESSGTCPINHCNNAAFPWTCPGLDDGYVDACAQHAEGSLQYEMHERTHNPMKRLDVLSSALFVFAGFDKDGCRPKEAGHPTKAQLLLESVASYVSCLGDDIAPPDDMASIGAALCTTLTGLLPNLGRELGVDVGPTCDRLRALVVIWEATKGKE